MLDFTDLLSRFIGENKSRIVDGLFFFVVARSYRVVREEAYGCGGVAIR